MYLALLNENEKKSFLGMVFNLATADGEYSDVEKNLIDAYCEEMKCVFDEKTMVKPMDELIQEVQSNSELKVKKVFIFELIGLAIVDGNFNKDERAIIHKMMAAFNMDEKFSEKCENVLKEYVSFQERLDQLVLE